MEERLQRKGPSTPGKLVDRRNVARMELLVMCQSQGQTERGILLVIDTPICAHFSMSEDDGHATLW